MNFTVIEVNSDTSSPGQKNLTYMCWNLAVEGKVSFVIPGQSWTHGITYAARVTKSTFSANLALRPLDLETSPANFSIMMMPNALPY